MFDSLPDDWVGRRVIYQGILHCPIEQTPFAYVPFDCSLSVQNHRKPIGILCGKPDFSLNLRSVVVIGVVKTGSSKAVWPSWIRGEEIDSISYIEAELVEPYPP